MFKFNFIHDAEDVKASVPVTKEAGTELKKCVEHSLPPRTDGGKKRKYQKIFLDDETENLNDVILNVELTNEDCNHEWDKNHTDLVPGIYEGGFKVWECTKDLMQHIKNMSSTGFMCQGSILDLGCGTGLLGITAAKCFQPSKVVYQDYNPEVINAITIPNFWANFATDDDRVPHKFISGSWSTLSDLLSGDSFDLILTSETIYNEASYNQLIEVFDKCLSACGRVWLAAKVHYFGVGGGLRAFEARLQQSGKFAFKVVDKFTDGVGREILEIWRK